MGIKVIESEGGRSTICARNMAVGDVVEGRATIHGQLLLLLRTYDGFVNLYDPTTTYPRKTELKLLDARLVDIEVTIL